MPPYKYNIIATNSGGDSNPYLITINISDDYSTPVINYGSLTRNYTTLSPGETITPSINVGVTWSIDKAFPNYITFNDSNGQIIVNPQSTITYSDTHTITATNNDTPPESDSKTLTFNITLALPQITGYTSTTLVEGQTVTLNPQGSYLSNASNTFSISTNTNNNNQTITDELGLTFNTTTGVISGTVNQQIEGTYNYTVSHSNSEGNGNDFIIAKVISRVKTALNVFVLIFLFNKSKFLIPENSILIKCKPTVPNIKGNKKLIKFGKNDVILVLKKEFEITSKIAIEIKKIPEYK